LFGDGSDGNLTFDGTSVVFGITPVANVYTFASAVSSRDLFANNLTINTGVTIRPAACRIFVRGLLDLQGTGKISYDGADGAVGSTVSVAGGNNTTAALNVGMLPLGGTGGQGTANGAGTGGSSGNPVPRGLNSGGTGGTGGINGGGAGGGVALTETAAQGGCGSYVPASMGRVGNLTSAYAASGSGGGGGGGGGAGNSGGSGGAGGNWGFVAARTWQGTGSITAKGGAGGAGRPAPGAACGGGGGGGGGTLAVVTTQSTLPTTDVTGGAGGAGTGGGTNGNNGGSGRLIDLSSP
jgi:hypothetical protein